MIAKSIDKRFWSAVLVLLGCVFIINFLPSKFFSLHFGKDHGLVFIFLTSDFVGACFFYLITKKKIFGIWGFFLTMFSFGFSYYVIMTADKEDYFGWDISFLIAQILSIILIVLLGFWVRRKWGIKS